MTCQDISIAGKGAGIEGKRSGLWTEMHRIISEVRPRFALIENVPMLIHRGLERVLCDLAEIGYDCEWQIIGADDVGAWHRRKRIWIVAYSNGTRSKSKLREAISWKQKKKISNSKSGGRSTGRNSIFSEFKDEKYVPDTKQRNVQAGCKRQRKICKVGAGKRISSDVTSSSKDIPDTLGKRGCSGDTAGKDAEDARQLRGSPPYGYWAVEPDVGRVAHGIPNRVDRLKGLGNAVVPQVAALIMEKIKDAEFRRVHQTKDK